MKNATIQLKGRQSVKTPSVTLLSGCCQVGECTALDRRAWAVRAANGAGPRVDRRQPVCQPRRCAGVGACVPVRSAARLSTDRPAVNFIAKEAAERAGVNPAASIHWLRHAHASRAIDNGWTVLYRCNGGFAGNVGFLIASRTLISFAMSLRSPLWR